MYQGNNSLANVEFSISQPEKTIKVGELIEFLESFDYDLPVVFVYKRGGPISVNVNKNWKNSKPREISPRLGIKTENFQELGPRPGFKNGYLELNIKGVPGR